MRSSQQSQTAAAAGARDPVSFPVVLASDSPRRRDLIQRAGIRFSLCSCSTPEKSFRGQPRRTVRHNAEAKARAAARRHPRALIITADTIVYLRHVYGKPSDPERAERMLLSLSGRTHTVYSAVTVSLPSRRLRVTRVAATKVRMKRFDRETVRAYFGKVDPLDKAGAYAIQGRAAYMIRQIRGSYTNVVGLPLTELVEILAVEFGIQPTFHGPAGA